MNARDQLLEILADNHRYGKPGDGDEAAADRILREIVQPMMVMAYCEGSAIYGGMGQGDIGGTVRVAKDWAARIITDLTATREGDNG